MTVGFSSAAGGGTVSGVWLGRRTMTVGFSADGIDSGTGAAGALPASGGRRTTVGGSADGAELGGEPTPPGELAATSRLSGESGAGGGVAAGGAARPSFRGRSTPPTMVRGPADNGVEVGRCVP